MRIVLFFGFTTRVIFALMVNQAVNYVSNAVINNLKPLDSTEIVIEKLLGAHTFQLFVMKNLSFMPDFLASCKLAHELTRISTTKEVYFQVKASSNL